MVKIIGSNRLSLFGDCICSLPFSSYIKKRYPNSVNIAYLDIKCQQLLPLLINQDCFDGIRISELPDKISQNDQNYFKNFDLVFEPFPSVTEDYYYNHRSVIEETFRMSTLRDAGRVNPIEWDKLNEEEKRPHLKRWFEVKKNNNYIALWASSGYSSDPVNQKRNPTKEYWAGLVNRLLKEGYKVAQFGTRDHELVSEKVLDLRHYSLFDAIKFTLGSICSIGTDSGSQHIVAAYSHPQLVLSTYWRAGHVQNPSALIPVNPNLKLLWNNENINNINHDDVVNGVKEAVG